MWTNEKEQTSEDLTDQVEMIWIPATNTRQQALKETPDEQLEKGCPACDVQESVQLRRFRKNHQQPRDVEDICHVESSDKCTSSGMKLHSNMIH